MKTGITFLDLFRVVVAGLKDVKDGKSSEDVPVSVERRLCVTFVGELLFFVQLQQKSTDKTTTLPVAKFGPTGIDACIHAVWRSGSVVRRTNKLLNVEPS